MGRCACCQSKNLILYAGADSLILIRIRNNDITSVVSIANQGVRDAAVELLHTLVAVHAEVPFNDVLLYYLYCIKDLIKIVFAGFCWCETPAGQDSGCSR